MKNIILFALYSFFIIIEFLPFLSIFILIGALAGMFIHHIAFWTIFGLVILFALLKAWAEAYK